MLKWQHLFRNKPLLFLSLFKINMKRTIFFNGLLTNVYMCLNFYNFYQFLKRGNSRHGVQLSWKVCFWLDGDIMERKV